MFDMITSIEMISALVANGTTAFNWGYTPWLPFYNFIPVTILAAIGFWFLTKKRLEAVMFLVSGYSSLLPTYLIWYAVDLDPIMVFFFWAVNVLVIWRAQVWLWDSLSRVIEVEKELDRK